MTAGSEEPGPTANTAREALDPKRSLIDLFSVLRRGQTRIGGTDGLRHWLRTGTGIVSAGVTTIISILTLVFLLVPALRPESGSPVFGATLSDPRLEQGVTLADVYARRGLQAPADYSPAQLSTTGVLASFVVVIEGYRGETVRLVWSLFDDTTKTRIADPTFLDQPGWPDGAFKPVGERDQASGEVWVQLPDQPGTYAVRLELFDPNGQRLTSLDSAPIIVTAKLPPAAPAPGGLPTPAGPTSFTAIPGGPA